jgi:single-stranded DNA-binding protein
MNNPTIIGFVSGDAEVIDLNQQDGSTVVTFSVVSTIVRGASFFRKEYATCHHITVYGDLRYFASTIEKGDLVLVSDLTYTQSFTDTKGKVKNYAVRANNVEMLKRKNAYTPNAPTSPTPHHLQLVAA